MKHLEGKTAIVTGASKGIGLATARELAHQGCRVMLAARSAARIEEAAAQLRTEGKEAHSQTCDVSRFDNVDQLISNTIKSFGQLDILINNAGVIDPIAPIYSADVDAWANLIDINVKGVFHGIRSALPHMISQASGTIINISSGAANAAMEGWSAYCTSKAAVKMLTMSAHKEASDRGVNVIGLSPGTVATDMMRHIRDSGVNPVSQLDWSTHIPPEWVARAIGVLCGPKGRFYSGADFSIKTAEGRKLVGLPHEGAPDG